MKGFRQKNNILKFCQTLMPVSNNDISENPVGGNTGQTTLRIRNQNQPQKTPLKRPINWYYNLINVKDTKTT